MTHGALAQGFDEAKALDQQVNQLHSEGRYSDAIPFAERALAIREKALGPDHPDVARALNDLANLYEDQGRNADAEPLYKRSLVIRQKALERWSRLFEQIFRLDKWRVCQG